MDRIRTVFLPVALVAVTLLAGPSSALTLDDAIAIAIENNRDITAAAHSLASANLAIATARSNRLPQFSTETLAGQSITEVGVDFPAGAFGVFDGIGPRHPLHAGANDAHAVARAGVMHV